MLLSVFFLIFKINVNLFWIGTSLSNEFAPAFPDIFIVEVLEPKTLAIFFFSASFSPISWFNSEYNFDWNDPIFLFDFISKCLIDVKLSKSSTYKKFKNIIINNADKGNIISSVLYYINGTIPEEIKRALDKTKGKVHWKDLQTDSNKKFMILKAETKQLVKKYNKENGTKLKVPTTLEQIKLVREEMGLDIKL